MTTDHHNPAADHDDHDDVRLDVALVTAAYEAGGEAAVANYLRSLGVTEAALEQALPQVLADIIGIQPEGLVQVDFEQVQAAYASGGEMAVAEYLLSLGVPEDAVPDLLRRVLAEVLGIGLPADGYNTEERDFAAFMGAIQTMYNAEGAGAVRATLAQNGLPDEAIEQVMALLAET